MTNLNELRKQAMIHHSRGKLEEAAAGYAAVLSQNPEDFESLFLTGLLEGQRRNFQAAIDALQRALAVDPNHLDCHLNLARAFRGAGDPAASLEVAEKSLAIDAESSEATFAKAAALGDLGKTQEALGVLDELLQKQPRLSEAWLERGALLQSTGDWTAALEAYKKARISNPTIASHHLHEGEALLALNRNQEAREAFDRVVQTDANLVAGHLGRATAMLRLHNIVGALLNADKARQLDPNSAQAHYILGCGEAELGHLEQALSFLDEALQRQPSHADAHFAKGEVLQKLQRYDEAAEFFEKARDLSPKLTMAVGNLLSARLSNADWQGYDELVAEITEKIKIEVPVVAPTTLLSIVDDPILLHQHATTTANQFFPRAARALARNRNTTSETLHIGFVGADFGDSLVGTRLLATWESRNRQKLRLTLIDTGLSDGSSVRSRLESAADDVLVVTDLSDSEAANRIAALQLDALINLGGYLEHARPGIFALRPCQVQATTLYPSTMGADYFDYLITDPLAAPDGDQLPFSERLLLMPEITFGAHPLADMAAELPSRESLGLPSDGFVLACLQSASVITPAIFSAWMKILKAAPSAILCIRGGTERMQSNLRTTAEAAKVNPDRIMFITLSKTSDYFAALRTADLCLDTAPWGSADPLSVGTPVLTIEGSSLSARTSSAALRHLGATDLITSSVNDYVERALELIQDNKRLAELKSSLAHQRDKATFFNSEILAGDWEKALRAMTTGSIEPDSPRKITVNR